MSQRTRRIIGVAILAVAVGVWGYFLLKELPYAISGVAASAKVEVSVPGAKGRVRAKVIHSVGGQPVRASLDTWFYRLREGDEVPVLYLPDDPTVVQPADPWRRYLPLVAVAGMMGAFCYAFGVFGLFRRPSPVSGKDAEPGAAADGGG